MYVPFETLPLTSRIWVYQSDRQLTSTDKNTISDYLVTFTNRWTAHNQMLGASFSILLDHFVVLAVNEEINPASGCSIDDSVKAMRKLGEQTNIDFFQRTNVPFLKNEEVHVVPIAELKSQLEEGKWNSETLVFNTAITSMAELKNNWCVQAGESWLKRYLSKTTSTTANG